MEETTLMEEMQDDIIRELEESNRERGRIARSSHAKKRGGRKVLMPCDFLTGKERKEYMNNSAVETFDLSAPMSYAAFKRLTPANKKMQLEIYGNIYGWSTLAIAEVLGCSDFAVRTVLAESGLSEIFKEKRKTASKVKRAEQMANRERLRTVRGENAAPAPEPARESILPESPTPVISEPKNAVQAHSGPESETTQISGRAAVVKGGLAALADDFPLTWNYAVTVTITRLG